MKTVLFILLSIFGAFAATTVETLDLSLPAIYGGGETAGVLYENYAYYIENPCMNFCKYILICQANTTDNPSIMKWDPSTLTAKSYLKFTSGTNFLMAFVSGSNAYFGGGNRKNNNTLIKVNLKTFTESAVLSIDSIYGLVVAGTSLGNYGYLATRSAQFYLLKVDLNTMKMVGQMTFPYTGYYIPTLNAYGSNIYFTITLLDQVIYQIDGTTFELKNNITGGIPRTTSSSANGKYLYYAANQNTYPISKFDMSTGTFITNSTLEVTISSILAYKDFVFALDIYDTIYKLNATTLELITSNTISLSNSFHFSFGYKNNICVENQNFIVQMDIDTLNISNWAYTLQDGINDLITATADNTYAYFTSTNIPTDLIKVEMSSFTKVKNTKLSGYITQMVESGDYLYAVTGDYYDGLTSRVYKIDKASLGVTATLELPVYYVDTAFISGTSLIISYYSYGSFPAVHEIDLDSFSITREANCSFSDECYQGLCTATTVGSYAYYTTCSQPAQLFLFDLDNFEFTGNTTSIPLNGGVPISVSLKNSTAYYLGNEVIIVDLSTLLVERTLALTEYVSYLWASVVVEDKLYVSSTSQTPQPGIVVIDLNTLEVVEALDVSGYAGVTDGVYAYFGGEELHGKVISLGPYPHPNHIEISSTTGHSTESSGTKASFGIAMFLFVLFAMLF